MSQLWYANTPAPANNYDTDLNNMRAMFETLRTGNSGSSAPSNAVEGMVWRDTNKKLLKVRGVAAWFGLMHGSRSAKVYQYRNDTDEGWIVDTSVTDCVLAFKGGSQAYDRTGGGLAGSWAFPSHTHGVNFEHNHQWYDSQGASSGNDHTYNASGAAIDLPVASTQMPVAKRTLAYEELPGDNSVTPWLQDMYTSKASGGVTASSGGTSTYRPRAAVGTLQYMDV